MVYWMQRAQRALDNPALDVAVELGNELGKPVVAFLAPVPFYPHANLRHYRFLASGIPDIAEELSKHNVGFVLRTYPDDKFGPDPYCYPERNRRAGAKRRPTRNTLLPFKAHYRLGRQTVVEVVALPVHGEGLWRTPRVQREQDD